MSGNSREAAFPEAQPRALITAEDAVAEWKRTAPADEILPYYSVWTKFPVIHGVFFSRAVANLLYEILLLKSATQCNEWFFRRSVPETQQAVGAEFVLSNQYYESEDHLFKVYVDDRPNLYAVDAGIRTIAPGNPIARNYPGQEWVLIASSCMAFIQHLKPRGDWRHRIGPDAEPSVFGTFAAVSAIRSFAEGKTARAFVKDVDSSLGDVVHGMTSNEVVLYDRTHFAYKRKGANVGCLSTTEQAYRIAKFLHDLDIDIRPLDNFFDKYSSQALSFVRDCWDEDTGGFKSDPDEDTVPDLTHTRYGLELLSALLARDDIQPTDVSWLRIEKCLEFIGSCWSNHGFSTVPGGQPTMCSLRDALSVLKSLMIFKLRGVGSTQDGSALFSQLLERSLWCGTVFPTLCVDKKNKLCYAYPIPVIQQWALSDPSNDSRREEHISSGNDLFNDEQMLSFGQARRLVDVIAHSRKLYAGESVRVFGSGMPHAYSAEELRTLKSRDYLVVVSMSDNRVRRLIRTPYVDRANEQQVYQALSRKFNELIKE